MRAAIAPALALLLLASGARAQLVDGVAAIVDKDVILLSEVELSARMVIERAERQRGELPPEAVQQIFRDALQNLIDTRLIEQYAERANLAAQPVDIDQTVESIAADEGITPDEIYAAAAAQGLEREAYRRELGSQITRMKVMSAAVRSRITVTDEEITALFEERYASQSPGLRVTARHILLPLPGDGPGLDSSKERVRMREIAEVIRERAIETGQFASLAAQYSRAPSASDGGLTTFKEGDVAPEIREAVFGQPPGEITPVIETEHGLNIFQIVDRFDPAEIAYDDVKDSLRIIACQVQPV